MDPEKGYVIFFEGIAGSGKTCLVKYLKKHYDTLGIIEKFVDEWKAFQLEETPIYCSWKSYINKHSEVLMNIGRKLILVDRSAYTQAIYREEGIKDWLFSAVSLHNELKKVANVFVIFLHTSILKGMQRTKRRNESEYHCYENSRDAVKEFDIDFQNEVYQKYEKVSKKYFDIKIDTDGLTEEEVRLKCIETIDLLMSLSKTK